MNGPFQVAQANIPVQSANAGRTRIVKVAKPFSDQSIVVPLSYDGTVKADLSAIAGENITLVHIGEKLIILFDNKSTVTLEPFFDSAGKPLDAISVEVSPGRQLTGAEFAALFPVTEDQSVLPASGSGNAGGAQSSGANFSTVGIDPLAAPNPIDLLGQEELPTFVIDNLLAQIFVNDVPTALANAAEFLDEDELAGGNLGGISDFNAASNGPISITGVLAHDYGQDLAGSTLLLATGAPAGFVYTLSGNGTVLTVSQVQNGVSVDVLRMTLSDTTSGSYTLTQLHAIDHPAGGNENDVIFTFNYRVTDSNGDFDDGTLNLIVDDDTPVVTGNLGIRLDDDDVVGADGNAGGDGDDVAAPINVTGVLAHSYGADGAGSVLLLGTGAPAGFTYTLSGNGTVLTVSQIQDGISVDVLRLTLTDAVSGGYAITQLNAIHHGPVQGENDQGFVFSYRVTDHDGDTVDGTIALNVNDDTPTIDVEAGQPQIGDEGNILPPFVLSLDESIGVDAADSDATSDDIAGNTAPDPTGVKPIGEVKTAAGGEGREGGLQAMFNVAKSAGADGEQSTTYAYSFNLSNGSGGNTGVATQLHVTDATGTLGDARIYLFQVSATEIIGYVGNSTEGAIALRLTLTDAGSLSGAQFVVDQYMAIDHGIDGNDFDAVVKLWLSGEGASLGVTLTAAITDKDGDTATDSQTVEIIGSDYSAIEFQDDGPTLTGVQVVGGLVIDETNGVDADSDETTDPAVVALFAGVANKGTDAQMSAQYATGKAGAIGFTVDFGTDGAKGGTAQTGTVFSLLAANNAVSGLSTSDGKAIHLFSESGGMIVGRYDSNGDNVIDATDKAAFAITINPTTGIMSIAQFVSLSHPNSASHDEGISLNGGVLSVMVTVTDGDGDSASQSVDVGTTIRFEDDGPSLTGAVIERTVDEDDIDTAWSQGNHPGDGSADGSLTEGSTGAAIVSGTLSTLVKVGADDAGKFSFTSDAVAKLTALGLFSKETALGNGENGKPLTYNITVNGNETVITAYEPNPQGNPVFSLTLNTQTGAYEFRLFDELIHTPGDGENTMLRSGADGSIAGLDLGSIINFTDKDGDTVNLGGKFIIKITDDVPHADIDIGRGSVTLDESAGNQADDTTSGSVRDLFKALEISGVVGQDPDVSFDNNGSTAGNGAIAYARSDEPVVTNNSSIGADSPPYPHQYALSIAGGAFSGLYVTDGSPINLSVNAAGLVIGTVVGGAFDGKVAFAIAIGADGRISVAQYLSIRHDDRGDSNEDNDNGQNNTDASPNDTPNPVQQTLNGKIVVTLTVKDSDGDISTDTANIGKLITFLDDGPRVGTNAVVALEDDDLQGGIDGGAGDDNAPLHATGTLSHDYGNDGPGRLLLTGVDNLPAGFAASLASDGLSLIISQGGIAVLKIELTNATDGKYTVTQLHAIDHPAGNDENNLQLTVKYTVTDGDGDTANGTIKIDVDDDMPEPNFVLKSGALVTHDETSGNDGADDSNTNFSTLFAAVTTKGNDPDVNNGFEPAIGYAQSNGAVVAVTPNYGADGPGSTVFSIDVSGNSVFSGLYTTEGRPITLFEVNSGLIVGRYDVNGGNVTASDPAAFAIHIDPQTGVMTVVQYVSLKHPNTSNSDEPVSIANGAIRVTVTVTDHDGDSVNKTFDIGNKIVFEDDGPTVQVTVTAEANVVLQTQDADTIGANSDTAVSTANFSNVFGVTSSFGVDGAGPNGGITSTYALSLAAGVAEGALSGLTSGGLGIRLYIDGNGVIIGSTAGSEGGINSGNRIFQIEVSANGTVKLTQFAQIDHLTTDPSPTGAPYADHVASLADGLVKLTRTVSVTDGDGDKASSSASIDLGGNIRFDDDGPKATTTASKSVDEDDLAAGNHNTDSPGDDGAAGAVSFTGQLGFTSGADAPATVGFAPLGGTAVVDANGAAITSGGQALTYLWVAGTNTLYATTNGTVGGAVFSIQVTNPSTGTYSFSLLKPLDHPGHDDPNTGGTQTAFEDNIALDLTYTVKDYDGDTATGKLSISIDDDMPVIGAQPGGPSVNLIQNGSFEQLSGPLNNPGDGFGTFIQIPGWTYGADKVPFEIQVGNATGVAAQDGNYKVELDSDPSGNNTGQLNATIQQTIAGLAQGEVYELTFWYAPRPNDGNPDSSSMKVYWNGAVVHTIDSTNQPAGWQLITVYVTAQAGSNTVGFQGSGQANRLGAFIDNVSLVGMGEIFVDEDGLKGVNTLSQGNNDSQPGDKVVANTDSDNNEATSTGNLNIKWGADNADTGVDGTSGPFNAFVQDTPNGLGDRSVTFTNATVGVTGVGVLFSHGVPVTFVLNDDKTVLTGMAGGRTVIQISLSDEGSGQFRVVLLDQLDHTSGGDENDIHLTFNFTATDSDGDAVGGTFRIGINDDMPVAASGAYVTGQVDEDDLSAGVGGDNSTGIPAEGNGPSDATTDKFTFTKASLNALIAGIGADDPGSVVLQSSFAAGAVVKDVNGYDVTSHGFTVKYAISGGDVVGFADANGNGQLDAGEKSVFRLSQNANGDITFDLQDQIDHARGSGDGGILELNLSATVVITDYDGDKVPVPSGAFTVKVENDIPADTNAHIQVGVAEDYLSTGATPPDGATGNQPGTAYSSDEVEIKTADLLTLVLAGADEDVQFSLNQAVTGVAVTIDGWPVTSHGAAIILDYVGGKLIGFADTGAANFTYEAGDRIVFTLTPSANGFVFDLRDKIDHNNGLATTGSGDAKTLMLDLSKAIVATDFDGDVVNLGLASIRVSIENDVPVAGVSTVNLDEDGFSGGNLGGTGDFNPSTNGPISVNATLNVNFGADGAGSTSFLSAITLPSTGGFTVGSATATTIVIKQGGHDVLKIELTNATTGAYTVTQLRPIDHPADGDENEVQFVIGYKATDYDGDSATGSFTIVVDDDTPTIAATGSLPTLTVDETTLATNATQSFAANFVSSYGADGAGAKTYALGVSASGANSGLVDTATGAAVLLTNNNGVIEGRTAGSNLLVFKVSVDASGNVTLDQLRAVMHPDQSNANDAVALSAANLVTLTATITDHDGDKASAVLNIGDRLVFKDDGPSVSGNDTVKLDDDVFGGNPGGSGDDTNSQNTTGTLGLAYGADGQGTTLLSGAVLPAGFTSAVSNGGLTLTITQTSTGLAVLKIELSNTTTGAYTVTQLRAIDHPVGNDENNLTFTVNYTVKDKDGDTAQGTLSISVDDDTPTISTKGTLPTLTVDETTLTTDDTKSFAANFTVSYGADGAGSTTYTLGVSAANANSGLVDTATGQNVLLTNNNGVIEGRTAGSNLLVFRVTVDASGNVTLDQRRAVVHSDSDNPDEGRTLSAASLVTLTATITDRDGDKASAVLDIGKKLTFKDDGPSVTANEVVKLDDDVFGGNPGGTNDDADGVNKTGTLGLVYGADGEGTTLLSGATLPSGFTWALSNNGQTLTITQTSTGLAVLKIELSSTTTGAYTVTQLRAIDHPVGNDENNLTFTVTYAVKDKDGDTAQGTLSINVDDDTPTIVATGVLPTLTVDETAMATNATQGFAANFTSSYGADGAGAKAYALGVSVSGVESGVVDTATGLRVYLFLEAGVVIGRAGLNASAAITGDVVFKVSVDAAGNVTLDQQRAVRHPDQGDADDTATLSAANLVTLTGTITDRDGDKATAVLNIGDRLVFKDDGPSASANAAVKLDDDAFGGNAGGTDDDADQQNATGTLHHDYGADGQGTTLLSGASLPNGFTAQLSNGGLTLIITQSSTGIAVLKVELTSATTGAYAVTQLAPIDHPAGGDENNLTFTVNYTVTDKDGDTASGVLSINVDDDKPTIMAAGNLPTVTVDESSLTTDATQSFAANFAASYGADGQGSTTYALGVLASGANSGLIDTATGHVILLTNNNGVIEGRTAASNLLVFKVSVDASGNVTLDQQRAVMHPIQGDANDAMTLSAANLVTLTATITDHDGDQASAVLNIGDKLSFRDDGPIAVADIDSVAAGSFAVATGNVITDAELDGGEDSQGADGAVVAGVAAGDTNAELVSAGTVGVVVSGAHGQLTLNADGSYSYARNPGSPGGVNDVFTYTLRDGDGDLSHTTLTIAIGDAAPTLNIPTAGGATTTVYEAGLPVRAIEPAGSNAAASTETTSGTIGFTSVDGLQAVSLGGHVLTTVAQAFADGLTASYSYDAATGMGTINYSYTLPDNTLADPSSVSFAVVVTDADGDTAPAGDLVIKIVDDAPTASDEASQNVAEGATVTGMLDFVTGADGATVTHVNGTALVFNANDGGYSQAIDIGAGTIKVKADGSYSFTADSQVNNAVPVPVTATYTVTDGDGDTATANIVFAVTDANKPTGGTAAAAVDDDGLAGGNATSTTGDLNANAGDNAADISEATFTGVLGGSVGGDAPGTFSFAALNGTSWTLGQESGTYSWNAVSNTLTATGLRGALFTVQVTNAATGAYKVTLLDNVLHAANSADEGATDPTLTLGYVIADSDGSTANGTLTITFDDDAPTAVAGPDLTLAETATVTAGVNLLANDAQGADGAKLTAVSFDGGTTWHTVNASGTTEFTNANGKYAFEADGDWSFDPDVNASTSNTNGNFTYRITDGDGDTSTATQVVTITNTQTPLLLVGSNAGDTTGQTTDHTVPNPQGQPDGVLQGGELDDTVVGDPGGVTLVAGDKANIVLVLDISSSMDDAISGGGSRIAAMENAVKALLTQLAQSGASDVRVHIVKFGINSSVVDTYDLRSNGVAMSSTDLSAAHSKIDNLSNSLQDGTNYEAGLQQALQWISSTSGKPPLAGANVNKLLFISDGEPNYYNNGTTATEVSNFPDFNQRALNEIIGVQTGSGGDNTNEVQLIENKGFVIEAVGISLSGTALTRLNTVEGANGVATNISTPAELSAVVGTLVGSTQSPNAVGNDTINGGAGADVIFGDVLNTDALAIQLGVNLPAGSGWAVFQTLENRANGEAIDPAGNGADWTRADTIAYIRANHLALSKESGRTGGHDVIDGGTGDDIIYGQEGNDTITGGDGNDIITGGTGSDTMSGGAGNDTFRLANGEFVAGETINGGADTDTIVLTSATVVDFTVGTIGGVEAVTGSIGNDNVTMSAQQWAAFNGIDLAGGSDVVNVRVNGSVDISTATLTSVTATETGNLTGTAGDDTITLRGNQLDAILIGAGTIDLGTGANAINLTSTSADLNGLSNAALANVQTISAATAAAAVTINMANQSEALTLIGSSSNDTITGGSGADTVTGGAGADTMNGGGGNDTFRLANGDFAAGETINGGNNTDTIVLTEATMVDFTIGTITNVENVTGSGGDDVVTLSAAQLAALSTLDLGAGTDTLRFNGSFTSSSNGQIAGIENIVLTAASTLNLSNQTEGFTITGSSGNDTITGGSDGDTYVLGLSGGVDTIQETGGTDTIRIQSNGAVLSGLNFENTSSDNLVIKYNGQQTTVTDHFATSSEAVEALAFTGGAMIGGYALGTGTYALSTDDDNNRQAASGVSTILAGDSSGETLTGSSGNDLLFGNGGNDTLSGGVGNDLLFGGIGTDTIDAGLGLDWIRYEERGTANQDVINSYNGSGASKDVIDLSALLDAAFGPSSNVSDFVKVTDMGSNALIQVDVTGSGNFTSAGNIATLTNYGTVGNTVSIYLEGLERQISVVA